MSVESPEQPAVAEPASHELPLSRWSWAAAGAALLVVALGVALLVVTTQVDGRPRAAVGQVLDFPFQEDPLPQRGEVLLPWARVQVGVGEPRDELPELGTDPADTNLRAPADGSFVRVEASLEDDFQIPYAAASSPYVGTTELFLRADGRDYPLGGDGGLVLDPGGDAYSVGGDRWVALEGHPTELEVHVVVDGVEQVVGSDGSVDNGRAAAFADLPSNETLRDAQATSCADLEVTGDPGLRVDYPRKPSCSVQLALRTPYVDGLGWAAEGRSWLLVHVVTDPSVSLRSGTGQDTTYYYDERRELSASLDGGEQVGDLADVNSLNQSAFAISDVNDPQQLVFDVPAEGDVGPLTVVVDATGDDPDPFVTKQAHLRLTWTAPIEVLP